MSRLLLIRGLPGSGKSTRARELLSTRQYDYHFEADMYFERNGEYRFEASKLQRAHRWCRERTEAALAAGKNVIVSNTFTQGWEIFAYFEIAEKHRAKINVLTLGFEFGSIHGVPAEKMEQMRQRFLSHELLHAGMFRGLYCDVSLVESVTALP